MTSLLHLFKYVKKSTLEYSPMVIKLLLLYCVAFFVGVGHVIANPSRWRQVELFGGLGNQKKLLRGQVSFLTWIFHWSMIFDFIETLRYMWKWSDADCTDNCQWKLYAKLHVPACVINGVVVMNHLHRDRLVALKVLHPMLVFVSSVATLLGSYAILKRNGWSMFANEKNVERKRRLCSSSILIPERDTQEEDFDMMYSLKSIIAGAALAFISTHFTS